MNNNNYFTTIQVKEAKEIVSNETQMLIYTLNQVFPNELKMEKLELISLIESLERRIINEINTHNDKKFLNEIFKN